MSAARALLAVVALTAACVAPVPGPCELEVRVPAGARVEDGELERLAIVLRERLRTSLPALVEARVTDGGVTLRLAQPPSGAELERLRARVEHTGAFWLAPVIAADSLAPGMADERDGMLEWRAAHPRGSAEEYNATPPELGGPGLALRWYETFESSRRWIACDASVALESATCFTERDLDVSGLAPALDSGDGPALSLAVRGARAEELERFAAALQPAVVGVVDDERRLLVVSLPAGAQHGALVVGPWPSAPARDATRDAWRAGALHGRLPFRPVLKCELPAAK